MSKTYQGPNSFAGLDDWGEAIVLDCETTGTNTDTDRVIEVAAIRVDLDTWDQIDESHRYPAYTVTLNPGRPIPPQATAVHGIRDSDVVGNPKFEDVAEELREWIGDRPLIGHNVQFDRQIINAEFKRAGVKPIIRKGFCTMWRYRAWNDGIRKSSSLGHAARVLGVAGRASQKHGAVEDARIAMQIAQLFYLNDTGRKDCLPDENPGWDEQGRGADPRESEAGPPGESADDAGCFWVAAAAAIIVLFLLFTCS